MLLLSSGILRVSECGVARFRQWLRDCSIDALPEFGIRNFLTDAQPLKALIPQGLHSRSACWKRHTEAITGASHTSGVLLKPLRGMTACKGPGKKRMYTALGPFALLLSAKSSSDAANNGGCHV